MTCDRLKYHLLFLLLIGALGAVAQGPAGGGSYRPTSTSRLDILLDRGWRTVEERDSAAFRGFQSRSFDDRDWKAVDVPHNWDAYGGYRRLRHGNLHGYAWYRRHFTIPARALISGGGSQDGRKSPGERKIAGGGKVPGGGKIAGGGYRYFLWFEGVGSYATVWVNGRYLGYHAGGRTSFTLDITAALRPGQSDNLIAVRADHPANIRDLPWVCGGCSDERGFSEGSQPMGIFRPVHLVITPSTRIEPFGVHIWNDTTVSQKSATLYLETEIKNYSAGVSNGTIVQRLLDRGGAVVAMARTAKRIGAGQTVLVRQQFPDIRRPWLWSTVDPYLYRVVTEYVSGEKDPKGKSVDRVTTSFGIRKIHWPALNTPGSHPFLLNGVPVFINGIAGYEHRLGDSHAFTADEIRARVLQIRAAGFNAFRDAHQPHNLLYQHYWDSLGILWWPQLSAHIWFDTPAFRKNFKTLLTDWIKERRNDPSVILWGLQNESKLPDDFARECSDLIRQLDPTAVDQRRITTCNGGTGTDWDVPQNWTGTYGGDPATYAEDLRKQILVGEYGAWRTADLHGDLPFSEDRMDHLMEEKIRLAESVKDQVAGHFAWLYSSHDNPGRVQSGEGWRELDRIGPVNYKGLLTSWEEPLDAYYLYRSNFVSAQTSPMVYIVSHTWPDRWVSPGRKSGIEVYSNCEEVELYNDVHALSLGKRKRGGVGTHFQWDGVDIRYNVLYAVGYVNGKAVAHDCIVLRHLPRAPHFNELFDSGGAGMPIGAGTRAKPGARLPITAPATGYTYLYRVNCGGPDYTDRQGNTWMADRHWTTPGTWGSLSWTDDYPGLPPFFASQRRTFDPIAGTADWPLFQDFRYGLDRLVYTFPVKDGDYRLELYFIEPWLGAGGGLDCTGWRQFDVAVNGRTVLKDLDIWAAAGHDRALKKTLTIHVTGGKLVLSFPRVAAGQALISALAIATTDGRMRAAAPSAGWIADWKPEGSAAVGAGAVRSWLDTGDTVYRDGKICISGLPPALYGAEWIQGSRALTDPAGGMLTGAAASFRVTVAADVYIATDTLTGGKPAWLKGYEDTRTRIVNDAGGGIATRGSDADEGNSTKGDNAGEGIAGAAGEAAGGAGGMVQEVYRRRFAAGATVRLGGAGGYIVAVNPATTLEPAYDSKPVTTYKAAQARVSGDTTEWVMTVGVGDTYSLTIKYRWLPAAPGMGKIEVRMEDGAPIREEPVRFTTTLPSKWNYLNSSTGTMINAGRYKVRLIAPLQEGLRIDELQVQ